VNRQQILPLVQAMSLPLHWFVGRKVFGFGPAAGTVYMLAAPFALHLLVLAAGFVVSGVNQDAQRGLRHGRLRDWLIAFGRESWVSIRQFYWLMPFREGFRVAAPPPLQRPPIVLIHGYGCNRGLWLPAARWFSGRGYPVSAISLLPLHCSIDDYAEAIGHEVARASAAAGGVRVALVAHSMGGLAARAYLRRCARLREDPRLAGIITLGTPHRGTHIARVGLGENARQMRYGAEWLGQLGLPEPAAAGASTAASTPAAEGVPMTAIISLQDNIVSRPLEQRLGLPGSRAIFVRQQWHMSLATSARVFRLLDRILQRWGARTRGGPSPAPVSPRRRGPGDRSLPQPCRTSTPP
jgi:pimeloyl-ACP methyl ester carboxylesterase